MSAILTPIFVILLVVVIFNIIIFVHELGHFLAARWRGLEVERFQIWFGKPIWKKTYNGVQYGLGWIPFGGFVALPQMVTMEAIEGDNTTEKPLPPAKPLDKIIVAFAGPLFSFLLAVLTAFIVTFTGKPDQRIATTTVGYIKPGSPAEKAEFKINDKIIAINGNPVNCFMGNMDEGIVENVATSEGKHIIFTVEREGHDEPIELKSTFEIPDTPWWQRKAMRKVGMAYKEKVVIGKIIDDSPADLAGLKKGDEVISFNGKPATCSILFFDAEKAEETIKIIVKRGDQQLNFTLTPRKPLAPNDKYTRFGIIFLNDQSLFTSETVKPSTWTQISDAAGVMKKTLQLVVSRDSSIGVDQLAGPAGIGKGYYQMLTSSSDGWKLALAFTVLFNINLAILNMLPFPVLDGGHITLSLMEMIAGRPVKARILEFVQTGFVLLIFGLFLYITSKDIGSFIPGGERQKGELKFDAK